ncbi:MAG: sigma-54-dependent Fis family transcriptional regulator [Desulfobacula sp.]|jgi:DNA-binding NtrC family response regulator|uniref:sigma-54-dependent transcriptional regulator n=1 Tax=Desulfobacula sp. TaxID=2593537 RepID=UPI001DE75375|nr:sigma-54-dependent Fis family transcriptional regulator [Desulfobacula sp.]MBT6338389.1 sigma-54-dependent Fis family transcriptional regulator [Desulfobacula sp.]MBT6751386.1 sigma-54-dependent Fis family transcriptional regulator [Desulfobacula sp.]
MNTILVIDDDDQLRISFCKLLKEENYAVLNAASGEAGIEIVKQNILDLVILDMRLPGMNGMETFKRIKDLDLKLPVIIVTAYGTTDIAIEATKMGAYDYVLKPFEVPEMLDLIKQAIEAGYFMRSPVEMDAIPGKQSGDAIIGQSKLMQNVYKSIGRVSQTDATVLIRGESGTGKELVARAVYQHGIRSDKAFLIINCVAIPETLLESELFGYEKGAFTGASQRHIGKIEQANGGTVFLDEIGDMPLNIQAKILRLLQEKSIERLGGEQTIPVDVRIIAATNKNLEYAIEEAKFREDLYFRLKVVTIELPALRDRQEDIDRLISYFMFKFSNELKIDNPGIQKNALMLLNHYGWPGNIRELSNLIQKILIFNRGAPISEADLEHMVQKSKKIELNGEIELKTIREWVRQILVNKSENYSFDNFIDTISSIVVSEALKMTNGNRSQAAKMLRVSRPTLHAKIDKYNIQLKTEISD